MSFPNVIYGNYGDEKVTSSAKIGGYPLGKLMILPDGRKFRHAQAGTATSLLAGAIVSPSGGIANHGHVAGSGLLASATTTYNAIGDTVVYLMSNTAVAGAVSASYYEDGFLNVQGPAASTYIGHVYKVKDNEAAVSSAATKFKVTLEPSDPLKVAFKAGTTSCSLRRSPYKEAIVYNTGTVIAPPMGVVPVAVSSSYYFWVQRGGECSVLQGVTACVVGGRITCATAEAGSGTVITTTDTATVVASYNEQVELGYALEGSAASEAVLCQVNLD